MDALRGKWVCTEMCDRPVGSHSKKCEYVTDDLRLRFDPAPGTGPLMANCLWHPDDRASMAIYADHVWCFGCPGDAYKWPDQLLEKLGDRSIETRRSATRKTVEKHLEYLPTSMADTYHKWLFGPFSERLEWLHARGLRDDTLRQNRIGHCGNGFTIPIFGGGEENELMAIRYRRDDLWADERCPKYWGTAGRNDIQIYEPIEPVAVAPGNVDVFLCEGELDALRLAQEGWPSMSLTNGAGAANHLEPLVPYLKGSRVYLMFDQDVAGEAARSIASQILPDSVSVRWPVSLGKDVTEFLQRWPLSALEKYVSQGTHSTGRTPAVSA